MTHLMSDHHVSQYIPYYRKLSHIIAYYRLRILPHLLVVIVFFSLTFYLSHIIAYNRILSQLFPMVLYRVARRHFFFPCNTGQIPFQKFFLLWKELKYVMKFIVLRIL